MKNFKQEFIDAAKRERDLEERRLQLEGELRGVLSKLEKAKVRKMSAFISLDPRPPYFTLLQEALA